MIIVGEIVSLALAASVDDQHNKRRVSSGRRRTGDVVIAKPQNLPETEGHGDRKAEEGEGRRSGRAREGEGEEPHARLHPVPGRDEGEGPDPVQDGAVEGGAAGVQLRAHEDEHGTGAGANEDARVGQRVEEISGTSRCGRGTL